MTIQLLKKLQCAFTDIFLLVKELETCQQEMQTSLESLENLSEQLQCCLRVKFQDTPLASYTHLQEHLSYKIAAEMQRIMKPLHEYVTQLKKLSGCVARHYSSIMDQYNNSSEVIDTVEASQAEPTQPSIATMLEWMDNLNQEIFILHVTKEELLYRLDYKSTDSVQQFIHQWSQGSSLQHTVAEYRPYLQYFLEEKFDNS